VRKEYRQKLRAGLTVPVRLLGDLQRLLNQFQRSREVFLLACAISWSSRRGRQRLNDPSVDTCSYCPIARQDWRSPVVHETQALGATGTLWSNALLARRGTEKFSTSMAWTCRSVSTVGVPTVLLRRSLPAELLPYFVP
jgi:hypothetical protein